MGGDELQGSSMADTLTTHSEFNYIYVCIRFLNIYGKRSLIVLRAAQKSISLLIVRPIAWMQTRAPGVANGRNQNEESHTPRIAPE